MNTKYRIAHISELEADVHKNGVGKSGPVLSQPRSVKSNSIADTCVLKTFVDSGALIHVTHRISLLEKVHDMESITVSIPDGSQVTAKQLGSIHMSIGKNNIVFCSVAPTTSNQ